MRFVETPLEGAYVIELDRHTDERGYFARAWCATDFADRGLVDRIDQVNLSRNREAGTLRGLHFQRHPHEEVKIVRCVRGAIFDVIVDLRPHSATRGHWFGLQLDEKDAAALYVPRGFAHGFQTLVEGADVMYLMNGEYSAEASTGIRWDDPTVGVQWPAVARRVISERDLSLPDIAKVLGPAIEC